MRGYKRRRRVTELFFTRSSNGGRKLEGGEGRRGGEKKEKDELVWKLLRKHSIFQGGKGGQAAVRDLQVSSLGPTEEKRGRGGTKTLLNGSQAEEGGIRQRRFLVII